MSQVCLPPRPIKYQPPLVIPLRLQLYMQLFRATHTHMQHKRDTCLVSHCCGVRMAFALCPLCYHCVQALSTTVAVSARAHAGETPTGLPRSQQYRVPHRLVMQECSYGQLKKVFFWLQHHSHQLSVMVCTPLPTGTASAKNLPCCVSLKADRYCPEQLSSRAVRVNSSCCYRECCATCPFCTFCLSWNPTIIAPQCITVRECAWEILSFNGSSSIQRRNTLCDNNSTCFVNGGEGRRGQASGATFLCSSCCQPSCHQKMATQGSVWQV